MLSSTELRCFLYRPRLEGNAIWKPPGSFQNAYHVIDLHHDHSLPLRLGAPRPPQTRFQYEHQMERNLQAQFPPAYLPLYANVAREVLIRLLIRPNPKP